MPQIYNPDLNVFDAALDRIIKLYEDGINIVANSNSAILALQERSKLLEIAKNDEEREMAKQQTKLYRISLIFANEEADIIEKTLGKDPAVNLIKLCKKELGIEV